MSYNSNENSEEILRILKEAEDNCVEQLDLSGLNLTELPAYIGRLSNLKWLNLENNCLVKLPTEISKLKGLMYLNLLGNFIPIPKIYLEDTSNPERILIYYFHYVHDRVHDLKIRKLGSNKYRKPPSPKQAYQEVLREISQTHGNKKHLQLEQKELFDLPPEISKLKNLTHLSLRRNYLTELPPQFSLLTKLKVLVVSRNSTYFTTRRDEAARFN